MSKKTTTKNTGTTKATTKKSATKKAPRIPARAEAAALVKRTRDAIAETEANLKAIAAAAAQAKQDHEEPTAKEVANTPKGATATKPPKGAKAPKVKAAKEQKAEKTTKREPKARRASGLDLAAKALVDAKEPLNAKTIAERAIAAGWNTTGATPHATLYAAMIREIAAKGKDARFKKTDRGMFIAAGKGA